MTPRERYAAWQIADREEAINHPIFGLLAGWPAAPRVGFTELIQIETEDAIKAIGRRINQMIYSDAKGVIYIGSTGE